MNPSFNFDEVESLVLIIERTICTDIPITILDSSSRYELCIFSEGRFLRIPNLKDDVQVIFCVNHSFVSFFVEI